MLAPLAKTVESVGAHVELVRLKFYLERIFIRCTVVCRSLFIQDRRTENFGRCRGNEEPLLRPEWEEGEKDTFRRDDADNKPAYQMRSMAFLQSRSTSWWHPRLFFQAILTAIILRRTFVFKGLETCSGNRCLEAYEKNVVVPLGSPVEQQRHYIPTQEELEAIHDMLHRSWARTNITPASFNRSSYFHGNDRCAINFYGLPRSFFSMTLPSVIENILLPNVGNDCHVFVHYHYLTQENQGRSGRGGTVRPNDVLLLEEAMRQVGQRVFGPFYEPTVRFRNYTEDNFWQTHGPFLNKTRHAKDEQGRSLYLPARDPSITQAQIDNIVRMWHSQHSVWQLMEETSHELSVNYTRVAMIRSDVIFLTPINIIEDGNANIDYDNRVAVVPAFAKCPVNDRKNVH